MSTEALAPPAAIALPVEGHFTTLAAAAEVTSPTDHYEAFTEQPGRDLPGLLDLRAVLYLDAMQTAFGEWARERPQANASLGKGLYRIHTEEMLNQAQADRCRYGHLRAKSTRPGSWRAKSYRLPSSTQLSPTAPEYPDAIHALV